MDLDGIEKTDFVGLSDKEILQIYNDVIEMDLDNDSGMLIAAGGNGWAYSK